MAHRRPTREDAAMLKFLRTGGQRIPADFTMRRRDAVQRHLQAQSNRGHGIVRRKIKALGGLPSATPGSERAEIELLALHQKLAGSPLTAPKIAADTGGLFPGRITVKVTPPFDYAFTIPDAEGDVTSSGFANTNGQLAGRGVTGRKRGLQSAGMYAEMGIFFHPLSPGTIRVSANPTFSFQHWTNSLGSSFVRSFGSAQLGIFTFDRQGHIGGGPIMPMKTWNEEQTGQVRADFGFDQTAALSVQMDVTRTLVYALCVALDVHAFGVGWPGSLAGADLAVSVPSITWQFDLIPVLEP
jgi:hypothetical protein